MKEAEFQKQVIDLARALGWKCAHFRTALTQAGRWVTPVQGDGAGFPDLVLVRAGALLFVELKSDTGRLRPEQRDWLDWLELAKQEVAVWRPHMFDEIHERLKRP